MLSPLVTMQGTKKKGTMAVWCLVAFFIDMEPLVTCQDTLPTSGADSATQEFKTTWPPDAIPHNAGSPWTSFSRWPEIHLGGT